MKLKIFINRSWQCAHCTVSDPDSFTEFIVSWGQSHKTFWRKFTYVLQATSFSSNATNDVYVNEKVAFKKV
jgi:hypothetical protein